MPDTYEEDNIGQASSLFSCTQSQREYNNVMEEIGNELENFDPTEFDDLSPEDILELSQVSSGKLFNTHLIQSCLNYFLH